MLRLLLCFLAVNAVGAQEKEEDVTQKYHRAVQRYNAEVMMTGSTLGNEAIEIKVEMDALKKRSEEMRRNRGPLKGPIAANSEKKTALDPDFPALAAPEGPGLILETLVVLGAVVGLAFVGYGLGWGGIAYSRKNYTAVIKCPGCGKKLRVPKKGRRIRVRCPDCGKESAYNPNKKKS